MRSLVRYPLPSIPLVLSVLLGCGKPAPVPAPPVTITGEKFHSELASTSLYCLHWPDGTKVLVWMDVTGMAGSSGGPNQDGVEYSATVREMVSRRYAPGAQRPPEVPAGATTGYAFTGRDCVWRCVTPDGQTGTFVTDGRTYDLAKGNVFLVRTAGGGSVTQLSLDLSAVEVKRESFPELAKRHEVIGQFVADAKPSK